MREIRTNILEHVDKFQLVCLGISCYQKKNGESVVPKEGMMREFVNRIPELPLLIGKSVGVYGNCPSIVHTLKGTRYPTKLMSFPITPTSLRVENPEEAVISRLAKRFKPFTLLPGWLLRPRMDMIEFSSIKLIEIIKYYKLSEVAIVIETLGMGEGDEKYAEKVRDLFMRIFGSHPITLVYSIASKEEKKSDISEVVQTTTSSSYVEDTNEEDIS